jgi:hypothetical protein
MISESVRLTVGLTTGSKMISDSVRIMVGFILDSKIGEAMVG